MALTLRSLDGGLDIPINRPLILVGRHPRCHHRLDTIRGSRRHCCVARDGLELVVLDLGSTNGIRINGQRVEEGRVRVGDQFEIAHLCYVLENDAEVTMADMEQLREDGEPGGNDDGLHVQTGANGAGELLIKVFVTPRRPEEQSPRTREADHLPDVSDSQIEAGKPV